MLLGYLGFLLGGLVVILVTALIAVAALAGLTLATRLLWSLWN